MALTLPAELLTAQTAQVRHPLIELTAGRLASDFPLMGNSIANPDGEEQGVSCSLFLPDGRYVVFYAGYYDYGAGYDLAQLRMIISDSEVTEFGDYVAVYSDASGRQINYLDAIAIDGSTIGLVAQLGSDRLALLTISDAGVKLSETQLTSLDTLHGAAVVGTDTGYALVHVQESGSTYTLYKRTSADFINWGTAAAISISGLDSSHPLRDPRLIRLADLSYLLIYSYATVFSATSTVYNLQYATSADLATWSATAAITATSAVNTDYVAPSVVQKPDGSLFIATQEENTYLELRTSSPGWNTSDDIGPTNVWIDSAAGKAYLTSVYSGVGYKTFRGMCRIDIDSWAIDRFYDGSTVPAIPAPLVDPLTDCVTEQQNLGSGGLATIHGYSRWAVAVVDYDADTITGYYFADLSSFGESYAQNVDTSELEEFFGSGYWNAAYLHYSWASDNTLWLVFSWSNFSTKFAICSVDLSQQSAPYEMTTVATVTVPHTKNNPLFAIYPSAGIALFSSTCLTGSYPGGLTVVSLSENALLADYTINDYPDFPLCGVQAAVLIGDTVWAVPYYDASYAPASDDHKWGLMSISLTDNSISYYHPPQQTTPGYYFDNLTVDESAGELFLHRSDGVVVFNTISLTWEWLCNDVVEGLPPTNTAAYSWAGGLAYDPSRRVFIYGSMGHVYLVPRGGKIKSLEYITDGGDLVFSAPSQLVHGYTDAMPSLALTGDTAYLSWTETGDATINWDREDARLDLGKYLLQGRDITWRKSVSEAGTLSFDVSHGHLFDPENDNSLLRPYLARGRGVQVRCGETVAGADWWIDQGTYQIDSVSVAYQTKEYPVFRVSCSDISSTWDDNTIPVAVVSGQTPEQCLPDLVVQATEMSTEDVTVPAMPLSFSFDANWLEVEKRQIIEDVAHRFQHFPYVNHLNKVEFRPFDFTASPVNSWSDTILVTPGEDLSDLTNRMTVTGLSLTDFQVTYEEQAVGSLAVTVGWYGYDKDFTIWYSDDHELMVKNPRLEVIESATTILFELAGSVTEGISEVDPYNKYCVVEVEAPNLVPLLLAAIATYVTGNKIGDLGGLSWTEPVGRAIEGVGLLSAMMVLGSIGNAQYEIWGNPVGYSKRSYSAASDDTELQQEMGAVKTQTVEGFLCHSQAHCQTVADFLMQLTMLARRPLSVKKVSHLADEVGDVVTVKHPYTGVAKTIFIHSLTRTLVYGGSLTDTAEGWVL